MAVAIKRFLTQLQRHDSDAYTDSPKTSATATRRRKRDSSPTPKTPTPAHATVSKAAEDLHFIITRFADRPDHTNRSTYKALITIFGQQCELSGEKIVVKANGGPCIQNPSDLGATYSGHKGPGYRDANRRVLLPKTRCN